MDKKSFPSDTSDEIQENYYEILGCSPSASALELKQNYQKLIKKFHPDKQQQSSQKFISIDKAYKTLKDEGLRKQYDASLLQEVMNEFLIHEELSRTELRFNNTVACYPCRCGENFVINEECLCDDGYIIECFQCSNSILIR